MEEEKEKKILWEKWRARIIIATPVSFFLVLTIALLAGEGIIELFALIGAGLFVITWIGTFFGIWLLRREDIYGVLFLLVLLVIEFAIFVLRTSPLFHGIAMFFYLRPWFLEAIVISAIIAGVTVGCAIAKRKFFDVAVLIGAVVFFVSLVIFSVIFGLLAGPYTKCYLAENLEIREISELPSIDKDFVRIIPMKVANRYAKDACQFPQHRPKNPPDIVMIHGKPYWGYILVPNGWVNYYNIKAVGLTFVDMTTTEKNVTVKKVSFKYAPDQGVEDDIYWQIFKRNYWIECERAMPVYSEISDQCYLAVPYISYKTEFTFPIWYKVPTWGGVFLIDAKGNIEDLSPEEARESPILKGQKIFPEKLVLEYIESQKFWKAKDSWWDAITNVWFSHEQEIEITDVSGQGNKQPFLLKTEKGFKWTVSAEPWGEAYGIYRIYLVDARNENVAIEVKKYSGGEEIGPVKACDYVRKSNPLVDWSLFSAVEPIPITPGGKLFWEVRVVPEDGSGISYVAFVDPRTCMVYNFKEDKDIIAFMENRTVNQSGYLTPGQERKITGLISKISGYVENGNTRWLIILDTDNTTDIALYARVEELDEETIKEIALLQEGDKVRIVVRDNVLKEIEILN